MSLEQFLQENTEAARELAREMKQLREALQTGNVAGTATAPDTSTKSTGSPAIADAVRDPATSDDAAERKAIYKSINNKINTSFESQTARREVIARLQKGWGVDSLDGLGVETVKKIAAIPLDKIIAEYKAEMDYDALGGNSEENITDTPDFAEMPLEDFRVPFAEIQKHPALGKEVLRNIAEEFNVKQVTKIPREGWPKAWATAQEILEGVK